MLLRRLRSAARRFTALFLGAALIAAPASATWSIIVVDVVTGEVVVAGATCLPGVNLSPLLSCIVVGKGGGAAQSYVLAQAKSIMFDGFQAGKTPEMILAEIIATGSAIPTRQFGIVSVDGPAATFTGSQCGPAATGVTGQVGNMRYSIQGNVLASEGVVAVAEAALLASQGDLGQRVMDAMEAATELGGDGRCSCPNQAPPCGVPTNFVRASATNFIILSRRGDTDTTTCSTNYNTCASGDYYGYMRKISDLVSPDPMLLLRRKHSRWRQYLLQRPDHYKTRVYQTSQVIKADGLDTTTIDVDLADVDGNPLVLGGQTLLITVVDGPPVVIGPVSDGGDGTHSFQVTSGTQSGRTQLRIVVQDGIRDVQLFPELEILQAPPTELFVDQHTLSATAGGLVEFEVNTPSDPGANYHLLGSASGTSPGTPFGGLTLPLNRDRLLELTILAANGPLLPNSQGTLDGSGQTTAYFDALPNALSSLIGAHLDFVVYQSGGASGARVTNLVGFDISL